MRDVNGQQLAYVYFDTASIDASCNAASTEKFLTDILANGPVVPLAPATDRATASTPPTLKETVRVSKAKG